MFALIKFIEFSTITVFSTVLAVGCGSPALRDNKQLGFFVPEQWEATRHPSEPDVTAWLEQFADPQLSNLVKAGLSTNFDIKAAAARVAAVHEQAIIAGAGRLPQLGFSPGFQAGNDNVVGSTSSEAGYFSALFNLNWEIDVWGRIKAQQQAVEYEANAMADDLQAAKISLAARIAQTYFEVTEAHLQAEVAAQSVKDRGVIVDLVQGRFNKGLTRGLDLRLVLTDRANAEAQLAQARNQVQMSSRRLQTLLGRYPDANTDNPTELPPPPQRLAAGLPVDLLTRRPDISAAFKRLSAADSRLQSAEKALLPRITLTAAGGSSSSALMELLDPRMAAWNLTSGLVQPIFTGGRLQADIRLNQAKIHEAFNQYQSVALNAFKEVEQSLAAEAWLRNEEQALSTAVEQTKASRKLAVYSYRQGLIEILTLLDSYRSTLNAQSAHLAVQRQLLNNRINLYLALGGAV